MLARYVAMRISALPLFALAASCGPAPADRAMEDATPVEAEATHSDEFAPVVSLAGEWRVAGIDGEPWDETYGLALSADEQEIWWAPRCAGLVHGYVIDGLRIEIGPRVTEPPLATDIPPPSCAIGLPMRLDDVNRAIRVAERVGRTPENGVLLEGGGHSLLLFSQ